MKKQKQYLTPLEIEDALLKATSKYISEPLNKRAYTDSTHQKAVNVLTIVSDANSDLNNAQSDMLDVRSQLEIPMFDLKNLIAGHIEVIIRKSKSGKLPKAVLSFYDLDITKPIIPQITSYALAAEWSKKVIEADAKVVNKGWDSVKDYPAAEIAAIRNNFTPLVDLYNKKVEDFNDAEKFISDNRKIWQKLVKKIWKEIYAFYFDMSLSKRRVYARLWGVIFVYAKPSGKNFVMHDVLAGHTINIPFAGLKDGSIIEFVNRGKVPLWICRIDTVSNSCLGKGIKIMPTKAKVVVTASQLGVSANSFINVTNPDEENDGDFEIYIHNPA